jgi:ATPase subunit of ABC transporter with duplicated ATPase domains
MKEPSELTLEEMARIAEQKFAEFAAQEAEEKRKALEAERLLQASESDHQTERRLAAEYEREDWERGQARNAVLVAQQAALMAEQEKAKAEARAKAEVQAEALRVIEREAVVSSISNEYPGMSIERRKHLNQAIFAKRTLNYLFLGPGGAGKTTMLRALADLAQIDGREALLTTGMRWENDLRANSYADFEHKQILPLSEEGLEGRSPLFIGFDEVDKMSPWAFNAFHALIDAIIKGGHQLVMTTNLTQAEFKDKFGGSLIWRFFLARAIHGRGGLGVISVRFHDVADPSPAK